MTSVTASASASQAAPVRKLWVPSDDNLPVPAEVLRTLIALQRERDQARAEVWALSNGRLKTTALTLVQTVYLLYERQFEQFKSGELDPEGWTTIYYAAIARRIGAVGGKDGKSAHNRIAKDVEIGVSVGLWEKQTLRKRLPRQLDASGKLYTPVRAEVQLRWPPGSLADAVYEADMFITLFNRIADYEAERDRRGGKRQVKEEKERCPTCGALTLHPQRHKSCDP
jgi:hypothetical protein